MKKKIENKQIKEFIVWREWKCVLEVILRPRLRNTRLYEELSAVAIQTRYGRCKTLL